MAPTYPESDVDDLRATLKAIAALDPITVFHEPINLRADNAARIARAASGVGLPMRTDVFATRETWREYAGLQHFSLYGAFLASSAFEIKCIFGPTLLWAQTK
jgi:hypothetical protein